MKRSPNSAGSSVPGSSYRRPSDCISFKPHSPLSRATIHTPFGKAATSKYSHLHTARPSLVSLIHAAAASAPGAGASSQGSWRPAAGSTDRPSSLRGERGENSKPKSHSSKQPEPSRNWRLRTDAGPSEDKASSGPASRHAQSSTAPISPSSQSSVVTDKSGMLKSSGGVPGRAAAEAKAKGDTTPQRKPQQLRRRGPASRLPAPVSVGRPTGELGCIHFSQCSGCSMDNGLRRPAQFLEAAEFFKDRGYEDFKLVSGPMHGWRCRAKLAVRGKPGRPQIGLFRRGSHDVVDIVPGCQIHHPRINQAAEVIKQLVQQLRIAPYDEATNLGVLRYLQLTAVGRPEYGLRAEEDLEGAGIQVVLVVSAASEDDPAYASAIKLAGALWLHAGPRDRPGSTGAVAAAPEQSSGAAAAAGRRGGKGRGVAAVGRVPPPLIHSIWINRHDASSSNTVLGEGGWRLVQGEADVWQGFGGTPVCLGPGSFVQANYGAFQSALASIRRHVPLGSRVVELHAGVGAIGMSLFSSAEPVRAGREIQGGPTGPRALRCVEINPQAEPPFTKSKERLFEDLKLQQDHAGRPEAQAQQQQQQQEQQEQPQDPDLAAKASTLPAVQYSLPAVKYIVAAAGEDPDSLLGGADVVIVDPPRKGMERELLRALMGVEPAGGRQARSARSAPPAGPHTLVYLSCGWQALKGEFDALTGRQEGDKTAGSGGSQMDAVGQGAPWRWRLQHAEAFLFFPGTDSIETLCVFTRLPAQLGMPPPQQDQLGMLAP